jgi:hypothetical protein
MQLFQDDKKANRLSESARFFSTITAKTAHKGRSIKHLEIGGLMFRRIRVYLYQLTAESALEAGHLRKSGKQYEFAECSLGSQFA